ncbi:MAG: protein phosphatase 2C domain-containing protein [Anaerolineae bacterium]|nr:protein phosphatase 2C domain-containing protein [Gloeobacterales cyanobacterium ES-bin-313]
MYYLVTGHCPLGGEVLAGRYRLLGTQPPIVEDLHPELPVTPLGAMPAMARPYQRLNLFRWAIPEVYTSINLPGAEEPTVLLDRGPIDVNGFPWPTMVNAWSQADLLKQLGWLIQIVRLWDPCIQEKAAHSLLSPENIGVLGWHVRLFYLYSDAEVPPLRQLGVAWLSQLQPLEPALESILQDLATDKFNSAYTLLEALENLVIAISTTRQPTVFGGTHPGRRKGNEDNYSFDQQQGSYGIICDGMGGHDGGEIASAMALASLEQDLKSLDLTQPTPTQIRQHLDQAIRRANQLLLETNQKQGRTSYRQMGTTVVAYCLQGALLHIAHVGDSRIYLVDQNHCQQLTVDDDVANLEVSMARTTTNMIQKMSGSGNLTQALGVISMQMIAPSVQTVVLPEDCLILLCSDGLCDFSFVEKYWQADLRPLIYGDIAVGGKAIIEKALEEMGHDNITAILVKFTKSE